MSDRALFAPLAGIEASEAVYEAAIERLRDAFEDGDWTPCRHCDIVVKGFEAVDVDPCQDHLDEMVVDLYEEDADRAIDAAEFDRDYGF